MRQLLKSELLDALKVSLCDLEDARMVSAIDPEVALLKQDLYRTIIRLEDEDCADYEYETAA